MLFNVESGKFLLALSSWASFVSVVNVSVVVVVVGVSVVVVGGVISVVGVGAISVVAIGAARGNLSCYTSTNQQSWEQRSWEEHDQMGLWHILEQMRF